MRTKNKIYIAITLLFVMVFGFFFSSPYWMPNSKDDRKENYDLLFKLEDWEIRVRDAVYNENTQILKFTVLRRTRNDKAKRPDFDLYNGRKSGSKTPLKFTEKDISDSLKISFEDMEYAEYTEISAHEITVKNVPPDYWYVSVNFVYVKETEVESSSSAEPEQPEDIFEENTAPEEPEVTKKEFEKAVQIDYRVAK